MKANNFHTVIIILMFTAVHHQASAVLKKGDTLPPFSFKSVSGSVIENSDLADVELSILYFFSTASCKTCISGLKELQHMKSEYNDYGFRVFGIAKSPVKELKRLKKKHELNFPLVSTNRTVLKQLNVGFVYPTVFVIGPGPTILRVLQGGGASTEKLLYTVAEKQFERNKFGAAKNAFSEAIRLGEKSGKARAGLGYVYLKEGKLAEAATTFEALSNDRNIGIKLMGKEGLAEVRLQQGEVKQARALTKAVLQEQPNRGPAHLTNAKIHYKLNDKKAADKDLQKASGKNAKSDFDFQEANAALARGNLHLENKQFKLALASYKRAEKINPYPIDALSNRGLVLRELGKPEQALELFKKLLRIRPMDMYAKSLLRQARNAIRQKQDLSRQKHIDSLVKDLMDRYHAQKQAPQSRNDDWTTPPISVSILGFKRRGETSLMERAGFELVLLEELTQFLQKLHVKVVDRAILDKLLAELKLGTSELVDSEASLKLGRILASRLIATGSVIRLDNRLIVTFRLVDTETTDIVLPMTVTHASASSNIANKIALAVDEKIKELFPLKGRIALVDSSTIVINLGKKHGVIKGMLFNVLGEGKPIELNGKILGYRPEQLGYLEVTQVEDGLAYSRVIDRRGDWEKNQKIIRRQSD